MQTRICCITSHPPLRVPLVLPSAIHLASCIAHMLPPPRPSMTVPPMTYSLNDTLQLNQITHHTFPSHPTIEPYAVFHLLVSVSCVHGPVASQTLTISMCVLFLLPSHRIPLSCKLFHLPQTAPLPTISIHLLPQASSFLTLFLFYSSTYPPALRVSCTLSICPNHALLSIGTTTFIALSTLHRHTHVIYNGMLYSHHTPHHVCHSQSSIFVSSRPVPYA